MIIFNIMPSFLILNSYNPMYMTTMLMFICLINIFYIMNYSKNLFLSLFLIMIFIGGLLILFMYVASGVPKNKSNKIMINILILIFLIWIFWKEKNKNYNFNMNFLFFKVNFILILTMILILILIMIVNLITDPINPLKEK